jgi:hypothetical protein
MKRMPSFLPLAGVLALAAPALAVDHNNVDAGRPLRFDDAETIAFREQALDLGLRLGWPQHRPLGVGLGAEYLYGFALNSHLDIGFEPSLGGRSESRSTAFSFGDVSLGALHNFNREYRNIPALSLRGDVFLPTGRGSQGVGFRLRGIMSKRAYQYGRFHLNLDLNANPGAGRGDREFNPGAVLGFSYPLGYPRKFTRTALAEFGVQAGARSGAGPLMTVGVGIRQQVTVRSVVDVGLESDVAGFDGAPRDRLRLVAGYSIGF